jgi:hypothetical protein
MLMEYLKQKETLDDDEFEMLQEMIKTTKYQLEQLQKIHQKQTGRRL